jgi:hypothetical protein
LIFLIKFITKKYIFRTLISTQTVVVQRRK